MLRLAVVSVIPVALVTLPLAMATAQNPAGSVLQRSPNMVTGWVSDPATLQFNFLHRFTESGPPEHQISNSPTFLVAAGLPGRSTAGFAYATSSGIVPGRPNEWEFFGRVMPFARGNPFADVTMHLGYNLGAASTDGELGLARSVGPIRLLAAGRAFSNAFRAGDGRVALAGGTNIRIARWLAVAGDAGSLLDRRAGERIAWSAGLQIGIPTTPHSFSLQATNANTVTLEGASLGTPNTRWGFEYTVPITLSRYIPALRPRVRTDAVVARSGGSSMSSGDTVRVEMKQLEYAPARIEVKAGTTVIWTNNAPLPHTVIADDATFDSGNIDIGKQWAHTFATPGTYAFHCTPHPFMKGIVVVK